MKNLTKTEIIYILTYRKVNFRGRDVSEHAEFVLIGDSYKEAIKEFQKGIKGFRMVSTGTDKFGNIRSLEEIDEMGAALYYYVPVSWLVLKKNHLPKWW